jgi:uncharacterized membrane protein
MLLSSIDINCVGGLIFTLFKTVVYNATTGKVSLRKVRNRFWIIFELSSLRPLVSPRFNNLFWSTSYGACKYITMSGFFTYIYIQPINVIYVGPSIMISVYYTFEKIPSRKSHFMWHYLTNNNNWALSSQV